MYQLQHIFGDCGFAGACGMSGLFSGRFFLLARSDRAWRLLLNTLDAVGQPRTGQTRGGGWEPLARGLPV